MNADLPAEAARLKAAVRLSDVIAESLALRRDGRMMVGLCPFHGEKTPSFYVYPDHFHCFGCGAHGDAIDWLTRGRGLSFHDALAHLGGVLEAGPRRPAIPRPLTRERSRTSSTFMSCWNEGRPPQGTVVEAYLRHRGGLSLPDDAPIRFHPRCQRGRHDLPGGPDFWPAMLALMTDPATGQPVGVHRTYLLPDGTGKAPDVARGETVLRAKRIMGTWGVVRLVPDDEVGRALGISEGIENALTAAQRLGWQPVWAAGTVDCVARFPLLPHLEALTIFADCDDAGIGLAKAHEAAARWTAAGREALIYAPPPGLDWNDAARRIAA